MAQSPLLPWRVQCPRRVRAARGTFGGLGPVPGVVSPLFPPSRPACPALCVAGRPVRVSLTLDRWYAVRRALCVPQAQSGCPSGIPRVPFVCVCARAPAASASPSHPPPVGVARAPRAVPALGAVRAVPRGLCPSACPAPVPCSVWRAWGGTARSRFPPTWLGVVRSPWDGSARPGRSRAGGWGGGGGRPVRRAPRLCGPGGEWGGGSLCRVLSLCLPWAGNKAGVTGVVLVASLVQQTPRWKHSSHGEVDMNDQCWSIGPTGEAIV